MLKQKDSIRLNLLTLKGHRDRLQEDFDRVYETGCRQAYIMASLQMKIDEADKQIKDYQEQTK
tara:strand:- start:13391 stop:13579 length:189 start_codon:yes stop_codon:yes gene_type:complete